MAKEDSNDVREFPKGSLPIVLMFRPTHYEVITSEKLQGWEECLQQAVGLENIRIAEGEARGTPTRCWCNSLSPDDCDEL